MHLEAEALPEFRWGLTISVDGQVAATLDPVPMLVFLAPFTGISVGVDRGGPVHWDLYRRHRGFPYTGALRSVTYLPGDPAPYDPETVVRAARASALRYD